jgi:hypothetical protein
LIVILYVTLPVKAGNDACALAWFRFLAPLHLTFAGTRPEVEFHSFLLPMVHLKPLQIVLAVGVVGK